jgi:hypothetical protein
MNNILNIEQPDLVVLTGDLITGNNIKDNATAYWKIMLTPMMLLGYPWASMSLSFVASFWLVSLCPRTHCYFALLALLCLLSKVTFGNHDDLASGKNGDKGTLMKVCLLCSNSVELTACFLLVRYEFPFELFTNGTQQHPRSQ